MGSYWVSIHYATETGNEGSWGGVVDAPDHDAALTQATDKLRRDKRRKVSRVFAASCQGE